MSFNAGHFTLAILRGLGVAQFSFTVLSLKTGKNRGPETLCAPSFKFWEGGGAKSFGPTIFNVVAPFPLINDRGVEKSNIRILQQYVDLEPSPRTCYLFVPGDSDEVLVVVTPGTRPDDSAVL